MRSCLLGRDVSKQFLLLNGLVASLGALILGAAAPPPLNDPVEGRKLAQEILAVHPATNFEFSGVMKIARTNAEERVLPLRTKVIIASDAGWKSIYEVRLPNGGLESLTILHRPGREPAYELRRGDAVDTLVETNGAALFAGSEFTLFDLGMGFIHWPTQILHTREMRKGRGCDVLESRPAETGLYGSVRTWIDQESRAQGQPGPLVVEARDRRGAVLKEFEIRSMKKVAGQWQVQEMELRNRETKARTRLLFEFDQQ